MTDLDTLTPGTSAVRPETRDRLWVPLISAGSGLFGVLIGGLITAHVQFHLADKQNTAPIDLENKRSIAAIEQRRRDRAEEIITPIQKTPVTYIAEKKAMLLEPAHMALPSSDAERVTAIVALYFPDANDVARDYEGACAVQSETLSETALALVRHAAPPDDIVTYQRTIAAGDIVIEKVLGDLGVKYKRRVPVTLPAVTSPR